MGIFTQKKVFLIFILLFAFFFLLNRFSFSLKIKDTTLSFFCPISSFLKEKASKIDNIFLLFEEKRKLKEEKERLESEKKELLIKLQKFKDLKEENEQLKKALNLKLQEDFKLLLANVIQIDILRDEIVIDKGEKENVKEGDCVILGDKVVIGRVKKVLENHSIVSLIFSKNSTFGVKIGINKEIYGIAKGLGKGKILIKDLPKTEIKEKEVVFTSSFGGVFPADLLVGEIEKLEKKDVDPFQKAIVVSFFDLSKIKKVFIIK